MIPVTIVIHSKYGRDALCDCTLGKTYTGVLIPKGDTFVKSACGVRLGPIMASADTVLFADDVGDLVDAHVTRTTTVTLLSNQTA